MCEMCRELFERQWIYSGGAARGERTPQRLASRRGQPRPPRIASMHCMDAMDVSGVLSICSAHGVEDKRRKVAASRMHEIDGGLETRSRLSRPLLGRPTSSRPPLSLPGQMNIHMALIYWFMTPYTTWHLSIDYSYRFVNLPGCGEAK